MTGPSIERRVDDLEANDGEFKAAVAKLQVQIAGLLEWRAWAMERFASGTKTMAQHSAAIKRLEREHR
jgi:hypothetical protein